MASMTVKLWGVRGSIPSPGPRTVYYGGNTACVSVEAEDRVLILDAGSGICALGRQLRHQDKDIYLMISHNHWDHIQGFPFFLPVYQPGRRVFLLPYHSEKRALCAVLDQMDGARFPVTAAELLSDYQCVLDNQLEFLAGAGFRLECIETNHPGGCHGFRIHGDHGSAVYIPDNELEPPGTRTTQLEEFADFCAGATVLIHDAQYVPADLPAKHGWGHSVVDDVLELAARARPVQLLLYHHDPERTDAEVAALERRARRQVRARGATMACAAAREGVSFRI